jgi:hypothetical protein
MFGVRCWLRRSDFYRDLDSSGGVLGTTRSAAKARGILTTGVKKKAKIMISALALFIANRTQH